MKPNLAKVSVALLAAVFILGCQDQGPVGPEGVVPQFDKKGSGDCAMKPHNEHCHGVQPTGDPRWEVTVTIDGKFAGTGQTTLDGLVWVDFDLNLEFFNNSELDCSMGIGESGTQTGDLSIRQGDDHVHVFFTQFTHSEDGGIASKHAIEMGGVLVSGELPPMGVVDAVIAEFPDGDGHWVITAKGRNRQNGCTGEGFGLDLAVTVKALPTS